MIKTLRLFNLKTIVAILLFSLAFWGITYTADWDNYVYAFNHQSFTRDLAFLYMVDVCHEKGWTFVDLFHFHIVVMAVAYSLLFRMLRLHPIWYVLLTLLIGYVGLGNQIRYYVAFPLSLMACYALSVQTRKFRNVSMSVLLQVVSMWFHSSTVILYLLFLFTNSFLKKRSKIVQVLVVLVMNIVIFYAVYGSGWLVNEQYSAYLDIDKTSSLGGGIFNLTPALIALYYAKKIKRSDTAIFSQDRECEFLYSLALSTLPLFLLSFYVQIIGSRVIMALFSLFIGMFSRAKAISPKRKTLQLCRRAITLTILYFIIWRFILPFLLNVNMQSIEELRMMLESYTL